MGKASRAKRERAHDKEGSGGTPPRHPEPKQDKSFPLFWVVLIAMIAIAIGVVAVAVTSGGGNDDEAASSAAKKAPAYADVEVTGKSLAKLPDGSGSDPALGKPVPTISGTSLTDERWAFSAQNGPAVLVGMAHWCEHCRAEIPRIVEHLDEQPLPAGVGLYGISTAVDRGNPNYPPSVWLEREDWTFPTLIDDEVGTAAEAIGLTSFPFIVFIDADGNVDYRYAGEMTMDDFQSHVDDIAPTTATTKQN